MSLLEKIKRKAVGKNEDSPVFQRAMAEKINGKKVRYVTERVDGDETVLGRDGMITLRGSELILSCREVRRGEEDVLFRGTAGEVKISELMSLDGVILSGADAAHQGIIRTVVAYYKYYR